MPGWLGLGYVPALHRKTLHTGEMNEIHLSRLYPVGESNATEGIRAALRKGNCLMGVAEGTHPLNSREINGIKLTIISTCPGSLI